MKKIPNLEIQQGSGVKPNYNLKLANDDKTKRGSGILWVKPFSLLKLQLGLMPIISKFTAESMCSIKWNWLVAICHVVKNLLCFLTVELRAFTYIMTDECNMWNKLRTVCWSEA